MPWDGVRAPSHESGQDGVWSLLDEKAPPERKGCVIRAGTDTRMIIIMHTEGNMSMSILMKTWPHVRGHAALRDLAHRTPGESPELDGELPATMRPRTRI